VGQEFDVLDPQNAENVGGLQLVMTNTGRKVIKKTVEEITSPGLKKSHGKAVEMPENNIRKIETSKPIDSKEIQETL
jgi:hypothetical protein